MTKKNILILTAAFLGVAYVYWQLYKDSFRRADIHISHSIRRGVGNPRHPNPSVTELGSDITLNFGLGNEYRLTEIKVVPAAEFATNKFAHPVWHLVSDSNSVPVRAVSYGQGIRGMHPDVRGALPDAVQEKVTYKLFIRAGKIHGEHEFTLGGDPVASPAAP